MSLQRSHYEVLGVPSAATTDEIKRQYRALAHKFHPDKVEDKTVGQKVFTQINQAYRVLSDPERRAQYDNALFAEKVAARAAGAVKPATGGTSVNAARVAPEPPMTTRPFAASAPAPSSANVMRLLGEAEAALMENKLGNAKLVCDNILRADPQNLKALSLLGDTLDRMGQPQAAVATYKRALAIAPSAMMQAKVRRLEGTATTPVNGAAPANGAVRTDQNRTNQNRTNQNRTDQGRNDDKPSGGLLGRLLGRK